MKDDFTIKGDVISELENVEDPSKEEDLVNAHMVESVEVNSGTVEIILEVEGNRDREERFAIEDDIYDSVEALTGVQEVKVKIMTPEALERQRTADDDEGDSQQQPGQPESAPGAGAGQQAGGQPQGQQQAQPSVENAEQLEGVGRIIAVGSGKGGVGKSTVAVNLALSLREEGYRVGVLDADIYGPSLPTLLGIMERPSVSDRRIVPLEAHGLRIISLGFLLDDEAPVIWRGPIVTGVIRQFLRDVDWSGLDYLVVDMPPGTGDAQLALAQTVPVDGSVIVTTPSELAIIDCERALEMFKTLNVEVLGVVENMSKFITPEDEEFFLFGDENAVERKVKEMETELIGSIPLDPEVRQGGDEGTPIVVGNPESRVTEAFHESAKRIAEKKPLGEEEKEAEKPEEGEDKGLFSFLKE